MDDSSPSSSTVNANEMYRVRGGQAAGGGGGGGRQPQAEGREPQQQQQRRVEEDGKCSYQGSPKEFRALNVKALYPSLEYQS